MSALLRSFPAVALRAKSSLPLLLLTIPKLNPSKLLHRRLHSSIYASASETLSVASTKPPPSPAAETNASSLEWVRRTDFCGELGEPDVGKRVRLCGWVALHRIHGGLTFVTLRDHTGIVQVIFFRIFPFLEHRTRFGLCILQITVSHEVNRMVIICGNFVPNLITSPISHSWFLFQKFNDLITHNQKNWAFKVSFLLRCQNCCKICTPHDMLIGIYYYMTL